MTRGLKDAVVAAAEAVLAAANGLPLDSLSTRTEDVISALKRYDVAETQLDDAIDAYIRHAPKGKRT
jgi:hypothetical protein